MEAVSPLLMAKQQNFCSVFELHSVDSSLLVIVFDMKSGKEAYHS